MARKGIAATLSYLLLAWLFCPSQLNAQGAGERLSQIPSESLAIATIDVAHFRKHPSLELAPWEILSVLSQEQLGVDLLNVSSIDLGVGFPMPLPVFGAVVRSTKPINIDDLIIPGLGDSQPSPKQPKLKSRLLQGQPNIRIAQQEGSMIFVGTESTVGKMITGAQGKSKVLDAVKECSDPLIVGLALEVVRPFLVGAIENDASLQLPPEILDSAIQLLQLTDLIRLSLSADNVPKINLDLFGNSPESAKAIDQALVKLREAAIVVIEEQMENNMESGPDANSPAMLDAIGRYKDRLKEFARRSHWKVDSNRVHIDVEMNSGFASAGVVTGLLLPAVQSARSAARRMSSSNNIKQLMLAIHNYESSYKRVPPRAICDADGNPLLSWRVAILPFIEENLLYQQFKLDEPWDSPHNRQLIEKMPAVFASPSTKSEPFHANYVMPYGEGLPATVGQGLRFANFTDGLSNTIAIVEVSGEYAVPWSAPDDFNVDEEELTEAFLSELGGSNIGIYDGSVRFFSWSAAADLIHAMLTHAGGELVNQ